MVSQHKASRERAIAQVGSNELIHMIKIILMKLYIYYLDLHIALSTGNIGLVLLYFFEAFVGKPTLM